MYSPEVRSISGGETKNFFGSFNSPSYCNIPAYLTFGHLTLSKDLKSSNSKALASMTIRSALKLNVTTASPSTTGPTALPSSSTITNGG
ncbi:hypothetical protein Mapa_005154 [Marchantia paleacea]|nr:hypothetical protein Mapa_005154 [Marchantia paleacea]